MSQDEHFCQQLGIDLVQAARNELEFLEEVAPDYRNLCSGPVVRNAINAVLVTTCLDAFPENANGSPFRRRLGLACSYACATLLRARLPQYSL